MNKEAKQTKITNVMKIESGKFLINDKVVLSNIDMNDDGVLSFSYDFNDKTFDDELAKELCTSFILESLEAGINKSTVAEER